MTAALLRAPVATQVTRKLIRADGTEQFILSPQKLEFLRGLLGADTLAVVRMRHMGEPTHVMLLDDLGHSKGLPINKVATELYHRNCRPGTTHPIRGDVVIAPDLDFGSEA